MSGTSPIPIYSKYHKSIWQRERYHSRLELESLPNGCIVQTKLGGSSIWIWACTAACPGGLPSMCVCVCVWAHWLWSPHVISLPFTLHWNNTTDKVGQPSYLVLLLLWGAAWRECEISWSDVYFIHSILWHRFRKDAHTHFIVYINTHTHTHTRPVKLHIADSTERTLV